MQTEFIDMVEETRQALQALRGGLIELYGTLGADPSAPQEVSRKYGINRHLTWKLSRVINAAEPIGSLKHLPGQQGLELAIGAFESAGASSEAVARLRSAVEEFTKVVRAHAGDREHLELTLESMGLLEHETQTNSFRELAYRGNSGVWGIQARTRVAFAMIAPSLSAPGTLDAVLVGGLVGVRRLRPDGVWQLFRQRTGSSPGSIEEFGLGSDDKERLLREFCSPNMPELTMRAVRSGFDVVIPRGQVGNRAAFDCYYGNGMRGRPINATPGSDFGAFSATITMPAEMLVFDLIFHHTLAIGPTIEAALYGFPNGSPDDPSHNPDRLPMSERPVELAGRPLALATPLVPAITRIADRMYKRMGWDPNEFQGVRLQMPYPPLSSQVVMRWPLPAKTC
jgi:hypothetical protein